MTIFTYTYQIRHMIFMKMFNITYSQAVKKIWSELIETNVKPSDVGQQITKYIPSKTIIAVEKRNWCKYDTAYWNMYGLTKEDVKEYNVFPVGNVPEGTE